MKKVYVRQVVPERQESNLMFFGEESLPEGVIITGNKKLGGIRGHLEENLLNDFYALVNDVEWSEENEEDYTLIDLVGNYFSIEHSVEDDWEGLISRHNDCLDYYPLLDLLELTTGEEYESREIHGSVQGEWQILYYPAKFGNDFVKWVENEYFNLGSQWIIHEMDYEPETAEDIDGYSVYLTASGYDMDEVRREFVEYYISEHENINPEDVVFFKYIGTKPNYERV